jgi:hypothetical protein
VEFFGDRIITDFGLGRDAQLSSIIASKELIWPPFRSPEWIELIQCTSTSFLSDDRRCGHNVGRMLQRICSLFVALGTLFVLFGTKWNSGILFSINMLFRNFHLSYGLLFTKLSPLRISSGAIVLFRLSDAIYVEVIGKMLITYSLIVHSPIIFGLIYAPDVSFFSPLFLG